MYLRNSHVERDPHPLVHCPKGCCVLGLPHQYRVPGAGSFLCCVPGLLAGGLMEVEASGTCCREHRLTPWICNSVGLPVSSEHRQGPWQQLVQE